MPIIRYKARAITPCDGVMWNGENIAEIQAVCPQIEIPANGTNLIFPTAAGPIELFVGDMMMRRVGTEEYRKLNASAFDALYEPQ